MYSGDLLNIRESDKQQTNARYNEMTVPNTKYNSRSSERGEESTSHLKFQLQETGDGVNTRLRRGDESGPGVGNSIQVVDQDNSMFDVVIPQNSQAEAINKNE